MLWLHVISHLLTFQFPLPQWAFCCEHSRFVPIFDFALVLLSASRSCLGFLSFQSQPILQSNLLWPPYLKHHPILQLSSYLVLFVAHTANLIHLSVSASHPHLTPHPCYHRMCGQEEGILFTLFSAVSLVCNTQEMFNTEDWRKIYSFTLFSLMLSCQIICHHNSFWDESQIVFL